ncbi:MAG: YicC/YloC family endoribonuclease [Labilithrix sp.]
MTGFGAGTAVLAGAKLGVEIRAVNHRYLDLRVRAPDQLPHLASAIESLARERLTRGRFDVQVRFDGAATAMAIDKVRARSVFAAFKELRDELAPNEDVPLGLLGAIPELFVPAIERDGEALHAALAQAFDQAKAALDEMRDREGAALADDFRRRLATTRTLMATIRERAPAVVDLHRKRLAERVERLRDGLTLDAARLEQEIVLFADKIDVAEELTRLEAHVDHFEALMSQNEAGRQLNFVLQEASREVNTIGAKCQDVAVAHAVVDLKTEIERLREQVQNVE